VPQKGDTIFYDQLCHASIRDGIRLSFAQSFSFAHNDMHDLDRKIKSVPVNARTNIFVVTESVFSMDGDICPLQELITICKENNAHLVIDEAHATGVVGEKGEGLVQQQNFQQEIFCRVHTFGKACGCHGAVVSGSNELRDYLVNFARSFVYTTALPEHSVAAIRASYDTFPLLHEERTALKELIRCFQKSSLRFEKLISSTPIQVVVIPGNDAVKKVAEKLQEEGLDVRPILYPTVPAGKERLRIVLHAFNTTEDLEKLIQLLS
jgi:8-amino-7-oxononanoate synthase